MRRAPKQNTAPVVPQSQLDEIEAQRVAQKAAYEQERQLIQQQSADQTSALQAMLNVYQRQAGDLEATRSAQKQEQTALLKAQEEQSKLVEVDRLSEMAKAKNQQNMQARAASRTNRVISERASARKNLQRKVFAFTEAPQTPIFSRRRDLTPPPV